MKNISNKCIQPYITLKQFGKFSKISQGAALMKKKLPTSLLCIIFSFLMVFNPTNSSVASEVSLEEADVKKIHNYIKDNYGPIIEDLRTHKKVTRGEIFDLYNVDPLLKTKHAGGDDKFEHKHFPITFGVVGRKDRQLDPGEWKKTLKELQVYVNVIKLYILKLDREIDLSERLNNYIEVVQTPGLFQKYYDEESAKYDEYSIE